MAEAKTTETKSTTKKTTATKKAEPKVDERDIKLAEQAAELEALKAQIMLLDFISKFNDCDKNLSNALKLAIKKVNDKKIIVYENCMQGK